LKHHQVAKGDKTVREVLDELLVSKKAAGLSEKYLKDLRTRLGMFACQFGDEKIINISALQVDAYVLCLPQVDNVTKNNHRRLLGVLFNFAIDKGYLLKVPITKQSKSKEKFGKPDIFTVEEAAQLLACCQEDILPAVALGLFAGLRPEAELWRLDWSKIHLERKKIDVDETKDEGHHASVRWVDMNDNLVAWLLPHRKKFGPICPTGDAYYTRIQKAKEAAGINRLTPDGLRHSFCSYHYALDQDAGLTMAQAGHTNPKTFFRHYRQRVLREDAERYFSIFPARDGQEKIVPIALA
jgi:integrase